MQQRQLRLGDILDDYCPRERRLTNHAVVAMIGPDVKQTRCTTCDAEHEYKHAKVPRHRKKSDAPAVLYSQTPAGGPKRVVHEAPPVGDGDAPEAAADPARVELVEPQTVVSEPVVASEVSVPERVPEVVADAPAEVDETERDDDGEEGPVHRPLIRATLPRPEGQPPPARPGPDFTLRQPGGRSNRFRPRHQHGGQQFHGNRSNGNLGGMRGMPRPNSGGRPPQGSMSSRSSRRHGPGRKRSK